MRGLRCLLGPTVIGILNLRPSVHSFLALNLLTGCIRARYRIRDSQNDANQSTRVRPFRSAGQEDIREVGEPSATFCTCALGALGQLSEKVSLVREMELNDRARRIGGRGRNDLSGDLHRCGSCSRDCGFYVVGQFSKGLVVHQVLSSIASVLVWEEGDAIRV